MAFKIKVWYDSDFIDKKTILYDATSPFCYYYTLTNNKTKIRVYDLWDKTLYTHESDHKIRVKLSKSGFCSIL